MFDYLGYGKSEGAPSRTEIDRSSSQLLEFILNQHEDVPVILFGQSLGGAIALSCYSRCEDHGRIRGIVVDSTFSSYSRMARLKLRRKGPGYKLLSKFLPYLLSSEYDPVKAIKSINTPLLILHSQSDSIVPFEEAALLLKEAPSGTDFWMVTSPDHTDVFRPGYQDYRSKLDAWISAQIQG